PTLCHSFLIQRSSDHLDLHSFPTRRSSDLTLGKRDYCREHFIQTCYEHLEECAEKFKERDQADELVCDTRRRSVQEIVHQSTATDRKSTRLNSSHRTISYAVFCLKKKKKKH